VVGFWEGWGDGEGEPGGGREGLENVGFCAKGGWGIGGMGGWM